MHYEKGFVKANWKYTTIISDLFRQPHVFEAWNQIINEKFRASKGAWLKFDWEGTCPANSLKTWELRICLGTDGYNKQLTLTKLSNAPRNL